MHPSAYTTALSSFLSFLSVLMLISPVPVSGDASTLRLIPLFSIAVLVNFVLSGKLLLNKRLLVGCFLYVLLVVLSVDVLLLHGNYGLMYLSTLSIVLLFPTVKVTHLSKVALAAAALVFLVLILINASTLLLSGSRLDVLEWQQATAYRYGINQFLSGLFAITVLFAISDIGRAYKRGIIVFYLFLAFFLGSRAHSLLSVLMLAVSELDVPVMGNRPRYISLIGVFVVLTTTILGVGYLVDYELLLGRFEEFWMFSESNRGPIFEIFASCLADRAQLIGDDVLRCTYQLTHDLDNSFMFVASSGLAAFAVFVVFLGWSFRLLYTSNLDKKWSFYIAFSLLVILSVDILVYRPLILLPAFIYLLVRSKRTSHPSAVVDAGRNATL
jgi:hypothetical protein